MHALRPPVVLIRADSILGHQLRVAVATAAQLRDVRPVHRRARGRGGENCVLAVAYGAVRSVGVTLRRQPAVQAQAVKRELANGETAVESPHECGVAVAASANAGDLRMRGVRVEARCLRVRRHGRVARVALVTPDAANPLVGVHARRKVMGRRSQLRIGERRVAARASIGGARGSRELPIGEHRGRLPRRRPRFGRGRAERQGAEEREEASPAHGSPGVGGPGARRTRPRRSPWSRDGR